VKILYRYILSETLSFFAVSIFASTAILLTLRMLHFAALIVDKGVEFNQILHIFIAIIPTFMEVALPLTTLLAVMLAFARFSGDSEVIVMRTSGVSLYQLLTPVIIFGAAASLAGLLLAHRLKPWGYQKLARTLFEIARTKSTSGLEEGIFNKLGPLTLYAEEIDDASGGLKRVLIDDRRDKEARKIITAKAGSILSDEERRSITLHLQDGVIHEIIDSKYVLTSFTANSVALSPDELFDPANKRQGKQPNEMTAAELRETLAYYRTLDFHAPPGTVIAPESFSEPRPRWLVAEPLTPESLNRKVIRLKLEMGQRYSLPFASLALALLALPLGIQPPRTQRTWGAGIAVTLGMSVFILYYGLFSIGLVLAQNNRLHPLLALWIPNLSVFLLALYLIRKTASEEWQSIAHAFEQALQYTAVRLKLDKVAPP